jgi:hypothetical protein
MKTIWTILPMTIVQLSEDWLGGLQIVGGLIIILSGFGSGTSIILGLGISMSSVFVFILCNIAEDAKKIKILSQKNI